MFPFHAFYQNNKNNIWIQNNIYLPYHSSPTTVEVSHNEYNSEIKVYNNLVNYRIINQVQDPANMSRYNDQSITPHVTTNQVPQPQECTNQLHNHHECHLMKQMYEYVMKQDPQKQVPANEITTQISNHLESINEKNTPSVRQQVQEETHSQKASKAIDDEVRSRCKKRKRGNTDEGEDDNEEAGDEEELFSLLIKVVNREITDFDQFRSYLVDFRPLLDKKKDSVREIELKKNKKNSKDPESLDDCIFCMSAKKNIVFIPCGHLCVCEGCSVNIKQCPMCRNKCTEKQKVFF